MFHFLYQQVCNFDIEIRENRSLNSTFQNCRIVLGFVIVRQVNLNWQPITFGKLEVIRDFLLLDNIVSEDHTNATNSLNIVFPKLQAILGHRRINRNTLSVLSYDGSEHLGLDSVELICGPIQIYKSPRVCFRYSQTYWRWVNKFNASAYNFPLPPIKKHDVIVTTIGSESIYAKITFRYKTQPHWTFKYNGNSATKFYFIIYHIDKKYYEFLTTGRQQIGCRRNLSFFLISDIVYTHYFDDRKNDAFYNQSREPSNLRNWPAFPTYVRKPQSLFVSLDNQNYTYERLFDIVRVQRDDMLINDPIKTQSPIEYPFKFGEYYIIKLEVCFDGSQLNCEFEQIRFFNPQKKGMISSCCQF